LFFSAGLELFGDTVGQLDGQCVHGFSDRDSGMSGSVSWSYGSDFGAEIGHGCFIVQGMPFGGEVARALVQQMQDADGVHPNCCRMAAMPLR
jgi:hypothetical protein